MILQRALVEVTGEGTEALAATGAVFQPKSMASQPQEHVFRADHPPNTRRVL